MSGNRKLCIVGAGGLAREVLLCVKDIYNNPKNIHDLVCFMVKDKDYDKSDIEGIGLIKESSFNHQIYDVVVAVGDVNLRKKIVFGLPSETSFKTIIHPSAIMPKGIIINEGSIIMAGVILTCNIEIGKHTIIDRGATIGHDCVIGDFNHIAPLSAISGNVIIGNNVFIGTLSAIKQNIRINNEILIGMGSVVINSLDKKGVYAGNPARRLRK